MITEFYSIINSTNYIFNKFYIIIIIYFYSYNRIFMIKIKEE